MLNQRNLKLLAIAFVIFYVVSQPQAAASVVNNAFSALGDAGNSFGSFVSMLGK